MSLINEALKRAKENQKQNPAPPMEFRAAKDEPPRHGAWPVIVGAAVGLIVIGGTLLLLVMLLKRSGSRLTVEARTAPPLVAPQPVTQSQTPSTETTTTVPTIPAVDLTEDDPEDLSPRPTFPGENDTNTMPVAVVGPPKAAPPKLQGIFFNPANPSAVVNGRTVYVGNIVGGSRVIEITQETVTLVSNSATNVLSLSE